MKNLCGGIVVAVLALSVGGCSGAEGPSAAEAASSVDTLPSGGVRVRTAGAFDPDRAPEALRVREVMRLGTVNEAGTPSFFGDVEAVDVDAEGRVYVLDRQVPVVRVYDADGSHLRDLGGPGQGPGEFVRPDGLRLDGRGRVVVRDIGNQAYAVFDEEGGVAATLRFVLPEVGEGRLAMLHRPHGLLEGPDGTFWEMIAARERGATTEERETFLRQLRPQDGTMSPIDSVRPPQPIPGSFWELPLREVEPGRVMGGPAPVPFFPQRHVATDPENGFWTGRTDSLRFVHLSAAGDTLRVLERTGEPRPVEAEHLQQAMEALGDPPGMDMERVPDDLPDWSAMVRDDRGRLWVERYVPEGEGTHGSRVWEVYGDEAGYLGALELPFDSDPLPSIRGAWMVGVARDELDVEHVVLLAVEDAGAATAP